MLARLLRRAESNLHRSLPPPAVSFFGHTSHQGVICSCTGVTGVMQLFFIPACRPLRSPFPSRTGCRLGFCPAPSAASRPPFCRHRPVALSPFALPSFAGVPLSLLLSVMPTSVLSPPPPPVSALPPLSPLVGCVAKVLRPYPLLSPPVPPRFRRSVDCWGLRLLHGALCISPRGGYSLRRSPRLVPVLEGQGHRSARPSHGPHHGSPLVRHGPETRLHRVSTPF